MNTPGGIYNRYVDFVATPIVNYFSLVQFSSTSEFPTGIRGINYYLKTIANVSFPAQKIDTSGAVTTSIYSYQTSASNSFGQAFQKNASAIGKYSDSIQLYAAPNNTTFGTLYDSIDLDYLFLQTAISVTQQRDTTTNAIIQTLGNESVISAVIGTTYRLDKSQSRGDEITSEWVVLKYDPISGSAPVAAILGTDYNFVAGNSLSDVIDIAFLTNTVNFKVYNHTAGYTFNSNPYLNFPLDTETNDNLIAHNFNLVITTISYEVLFPKLDMDLSVPSSAEIGTNPLKTYQNQPITITPIVVGSTGYWKKKAPPAADIFIPKSDSEWFNEINSRCDVTLEISDKVTNAVVQTKTGLATYSIVLANVNNYNFQFKTTLK